MRTLFIGRRLIEAFRTRSVVYKYSALISEQHRLVTSFDFEFGDCGAFGMRSIVPLRPDFDRAMEMCIAHQTSMQGIIRVFEETIQWITESDTKFNLATNYGHHPFIIHGTRRPDDIKIEVYGRGLRDLNLGFEISTPTRLEEGVSRLREILNCLYEYRSNFQSMDLGVYKNAQK